MGRTPLRNARKNLILLVSLSQEKIMKKGFTLIEMLVVVLIIGILSAVAIPQFESAIEKSRVTEALVMSKNIGDAMQRHAQQFPNSPGVTDKRDVADVSLKGGTWITSGTHHAYQTNLFTYHLSGTVLVVERRDGSSNVYQFEYNPETTKKTNCILSNGADTELYQPICNFLESL